MYVKLSKDDGTLKAEQEVNLPDDVAKDLIVRGVAEEIEPLQPKPKAEEAKDQPKEPPPKNSPAELRSRQLPVTAPEHIGLPPAKAPAQPPKTTETKPPPTPPADAGKPK